VARSLLWLSLSLLLAACDMVSTFKDGLEQPKDRALPEFAAQARAAAAKHFKQEPDELVLAFSLEKQ